MKVPRRVPRLSGAALLLAAALAATPASGQEGPGWQIQSRWDLPGSAITVPMWWPTTPGHQMALDIFPKGVVSAFRKSWLHICDSDLDAHIRQVVILAGFYCAYLGVTAAGVEIGIEKFGAGDAKSVKFTSSGFVLGELKRQNGNTGPAQLIVGDFDSIAAAAAVGQMAALRRDLDRAIQRLAAAEAKVRAMERAAAR